jgi:hypothetical protein
MANIRLITISCCLCTLFTTSASGVDREAVKREIAAAKQRIARLKQNSRSLQAEVTALRKQLAARQAAAQTTGKPDIVANVDLSDEPKQTYRSVRDIFINMPVELLPSQPWDDKSIEKVNAWLKDNVIGQGFEMRLKVSWIKTDRKPVTSNIDGELVWEQKIYFQEQPTRMNSENLRFTFKGNPPDPITVLNTTTAKRRIERLTRGQLVTVKGRIVGIDFKSRQGQTRNVAIHLAKYSIASPLID